MLCLVCQYDNIEGEDSCVNCGADLRTADIPEDATGFRGRLLGERLSGLAVEEPVFVSPDLPVPDALRRMREEEVDCLLVRSGGRLVGIFTERDAVLKLAGRDVEVFDVRDVMTKDPVILRHDDTLAVAINKMAVGGFRHIPIVDGEVRGVVAARDVFRPVREVLG